MDSYFLALALLLGLDHIHFAEYNKIDSSNLYYYDQSGIKQPIVYNGSVFIPHGNNVAKLLINDGVDFSPSKFRKGFILESPWKNILPKLINNKISFYPIFDIKDSKVIYKINSDDDPVLLLKVKPFVTKNLLLSHLQNDLKLTVVDTKELDNFVYELTLAKNFYNRLLLANMLAEDKIWFEWVQPRFELLTDNINCEIYLENEAAASIGHTRNLIVIITSYNKKITIPDDMLPVMGRDFAPQPILSIPQHPQNPQPQQMQGEEYYDFGKPLITRSSYSDKNVIKVVYPFKYFTRNKVPFFKEVKFRYLLDGVESFHLTNTYAYSINSLISDPGINDIIQPVGVQQKLDMLPVQSNITPSFMDNIDFKSISNYCFVIATSIMGLFIFLSLGKLAFYSIYDSCHKENNLMWTEFEKTLSNLQLDNWKDRYVSINIKFRELLNKLYKLNPPYVGEPLSNIFKELDKIYENNASPNFDILKDNIKFFKDFYKV